MLDTIANDRAVIGGNQPPGPIQSAKEALTELSSWLRDNPVIQSPDEAKQGAAYIERSRIALAEMEDERTARVKPLNDDLKAINGEYRPTRESLDLLLRELRGRLTRYAASVEAARIAEAERLRLEAEAKEKAAREAEAAEKEAFEFAKVGECTDVGAATIEANDAFSDYQKADRAAARAVKAVPVRIGSIMGNKALVMRTNRKLVVEDACKAIAAIGLTERIMDAIRIDAKAYEEAYGELPAGVVEAFERSM